VCKTSNACSINEQVYSCNQHTADKGGYIEKGFEVDIYEIKLIRNPERPNLLF
jgi:hypothetical protein